MTRWLLRRQKLHGLGDLQFQDTISRAKNDRDPNVARTAQKLFDWVK